MSGEMFGAPAGVLAYQDDYRKDLKTAVDVTEDLGKIAMQPAQQRLIEAHAGKAEMELEAEKRFAGLMAQGAQQTGGKPKSMAEQLNMLAQRAASAGLVTKAADLAAKASLIQSRELSSLLSGAKMNETQLDIIRKQAATVGQLFGGAKDEASWQRANALYRFQTGEQSPYAGIPYDADLLKSITDQAMSAKEKADQLQRDQTLQSLKNFRRARLDQHDTRIELEERRVQLAEAREERLKKAGGGKGVSGPVKMEVDRAASLIKKDYGNFDAADITDAAYAVAAEARSLRKANPALDSAAALQQAYAAAVQAGDFQSTSKSVLGMDIPGTSKTTFAGKGKSPLSAIPISPTSKGMVKDRYYVNTGGVVAKWNGKGFVVDETPDDDEEDED